MPSFDWITLTWQRWWYQLWFLFKSLLPNFQSQQFDNWKYMYGFNWAKGDLSMCIDNLRCSRESELKTACHQIHKIQKNSMSVSGEIVWLGLLWDFSKKFKEKLFNVHIFFPQNINKETIIWNNILTIFLILTVCKTRNCRNLICGAHSCLMTGSCWDAAQFCQVRILKPLCCTASSQDGGMFANMDLVLYTPWIWLKAWFKIYKLCWVLFFQASLKDVFPLLSLARLILAGKCAFLPLLMFVFGWHQ